MSASRTTGARLSGAAGMNRRDALRLFGLGALGVAAAACAPSGGSTSNGGDTKAKNFGFSSWSLNEEASKPEVQKIISAWESSHKSKITTTAFPYNEYLQQLTLKLNGGEIQGAVHLDIAWLAAIAQMGKLKDLGKVAGKGGYTDVSLKSGQYDGVQYGLPWTTGSIGLIGNQKLLTEAGIKQHPTTIAEFEDALRALKELKGVTPYAAATKVAQLKDIFPWMQTFGCTILDGDKVTIGDDASVDAVEWYKKLHDEKLIAKDVDRFDARALFGQGTVGFYDDAVIGKGATLATAKEKGLAEQMVPVPRPVLKSGDQPRALLWGGVIAVVEGEGSDAATDFALHTTSDQATTVEYFSKLALPPTTTKGLADPKVAADTFTTDWTEKITKTATPGPFWAYAKNAQIEEAVAKQVQAVLVGQASGKDAMKKAGEEVSALIKG
ncbi:ABC transporter substrate-binding protein [Streptomyces indicus]|uniref:Multiple sugar transport system substrate-binding protein n=1 Tax=Streptomyces indicus TaxID=417292 RepID=A0A1G9A372_9ACTN|nr:extracellular solute-binding protein [Streptomyces indicus]SDK21793.1 multiple sugar transport system substrate-binding protein [Streptomyces indicus]